MTAQELFHDRMNGQGGRLDTTLLQDRVLAMRLEQIRERYSPGLAQFQPGGQPLHFDFVDSSRENACAFSHGGIPMIGINLGLIASIDRMAGLLSRSGHCKQVLQTIGSPGMALAFAELQLLLVVSHEYGHHLAGHVGNSVQWEYGTPTGSAKTVDPWQRQGQELVADGLGVHLVLSGLAGGHRPVIAEWLALEAHDEQAQLQALVTAFFFSATLFLSQMTSSFEPNRILTRCHPPPASRLHLMLDEYVVAIRAYMPSIHGWLTPQVLRPVWSAFGIFPPGWSAELEWLRSAHGRSYIGDLRSLREQYRALVP